MNTHQVLALVFYLIAGLASFRVDWLSRPYLRFLRAVYPQDGAVLSKINHALGLFLGLAIWPLIVLATWLANLIVFIRWTL